MRYCPGLAAQLIGASSCAPEKLVGLSPGPALSGQVWEATNPCLSLTLMSLSFLSYPFLKIIKKCILG